MTTETPPAAPSAAARYLASAPRLGVYSANALADLITALHNAYPDLPAEVQSSYAQAVTKLAERHDR